jgi:hypothetical protein
MRVVQLATVPRNRLVVTGHLILSDRPLSGGSACKRMSTQGRADSSELGCVRAASRKMMGTDLAYFDLMRGAAHRARCHVGFEQQVTV